MNNTHDLNAFNRLYAQYLQRFIRFANTYVHDSVVAEDITADAFVLYWERRATLPPDINPPAYIVGVIKLKCLGHLQRQQVREDAEQRLRSLADWELQTRIEMLEACNPDELFAAEMKRIIEQTLATLPAQTQRIFAMSRYQHLPHKTIAEQTGMTVKGVEFHISKALKLLRANLKDYMPAIIACGLWPFWTGGGVN
jgi:RNA polymerase sigma-70 factor (ECF subfamily)